MRMRRSENAEAELYRLDESDWDDTETVEEPEANADGVTELSEADEGV